jgi:hypothetical protein
LLEGSYCGGGTRTGGAPGVHSQPAKQGCAGSQISPGIQAVPEMGLGELPGVHCHPGGQLCPASQISPGMHIADFIGLRWGRFLYGVGPGDVGSGDSGGIAVHPTSSSKTRGQDRMGLPREEQSEIKRQEC